MGLQIAKTFGAHVTGVDSIEKFAMMEKLGFDVLIDYRQEDFTKNDQQYDLILDAKTTRSPFAYLKALKAGGKYVTVGGNISRIFQVTLLKHFISLFSSKSFHLLMLKPNEGLEQIGKLFNQDKLEPVIDGPYAIEEIPRLLQNFGEGRHKGKIVIRV